MDSKTPGRISGTTAIGTNTFRRGALVRSVSHASIVPSINVNVAEPDAKINELTKVE